MKRCNRFQKLTGCNHLSIEQPVAQHEYPAMAALRKLTRAPLLADESVFGPEDNAAGP